MTDKGSDPAFPTSFIKGLGDVAVSRTESAVTGLAFDSRWVFPRNRGDGRTKAVGTI